MATSGQRFTIRPWRLWLGTRRVTTVELEIEWSGSRSNFGWWRNIFSRYWLEERWQLWKHRATCWWEWSCEIAVTELCARRGYVRGRICNPACGSWHYCWHATGCIVYTSRHHGQPRCVLQMTMKMRMKMSWWQRQQGRPCRSRAGLETSCKTSIRLAIL